eukprot:TRINITY_DN4470_c0_g2_i3.p1 TRINITY_DN4470_c0_g2~~TRINITY_DN4470_c0_g2_i3.p1  ORF type:complete len:133 (-),score=34.40 TRINITY_DN4470_c0_g2_i3:609-1007(-)
MEQIENVKRLSAILRKRIAEFGGTFAQGFSDSVILELENTLITFETSRENIEEAKEELRRQREGITAQAEKHSAEEAGQRALVEYESQHLERVRTGLPRAFSESLKALSTTYDRQRAEFDQLRHRLPFQLPS